MSAHNAAKKPVRIVVLSVIHSVTLPRPANSPSINAIAFHVLGSFSLSKMNCMVSRAFPLFG